MKIQIIPSGNWIEHRLDQSVRIRDTLNSEGFDAVIGGETSAEAVLFVQYPCGASIVDDPEPNEIARRIVERWDTRHLVVFDTPRGPFSDLLAQQLDAVAVLDEFDLRPLRGEDPFPGRCGFFGQASAVRQAGLSPVEEAQTDIVRVECPDSNSWLAAFRRYLAATAKLK